MLYSFDRFEDALRTRAEQFTSPIGGNGYHYMAGYLISMMKEFYETTPDARKRIDETIAYLEDLIRNDTVNRYTEEEMVALDNSL